MYYVIQINKRQGARQVSVGYLDRADAKLVAPHIRKLLMRSDTWKLMKKDVFAIAWCMEVMPDLSGFDEPYLHALFAYQVFSKPECLYRWLMIHHIGLELIKRQAIRMLPNKTSPANWYWHLMDDSELFNHAAEIWNLPPLERHPEESEADFRRRINSRFGKLGGIGHCGDPCTRCGYKSGPITLADRMQGFHETNDCDKAYADGKFYYERVLRSPGKSEVSFIGWDIGVEPSFSIIDDPLNKLDN